MTKRFARLLTLPVVLACVGALCVAGANLAVNAAPAAASSGPERALGTYVGATTPPSALQSSMGGTVKFAMDFQDGTSWSSITQSAWPYTRWQGLGYTMVWGIPMLPNSYSPSNNMSDTSGSCYGLQQEADGDFNADWTKVAQALVSDGFPSSVVRLGWEFNGGWFPWAAGGCAAAFVGAYQQIVTVMRSVSGANFSFEWNPTAGDMGVGNLANFYPGSSFVNYVGLDVYDTAWANYLGAQAEFNTIETESYGLNWLASFASQQGKQIVFPEWGLGWGVCNAGQPVSAPNSTTCGGDDSTFINDMAAWIKANNVYEATFWDYGSSTLAGCPTDCTPIGEAAGDSNPIPSGNINTFNALVSDFGVNAPGGGSGSTTTTPTSDPTTTPTTSGTGPVVDSPNVSGIQPNSGVSGTTVTIFGKKFDGATAVDFGAAPGRIVSESPTEIVALAPAGAPKSDVAVTVTGPRGPSPAGAIRFDYAPLVKWVSPNSGATAGGTQVTIKGAGFTPSTVVSFGGVPATIVSINGWNTKVTVDVPPGPPGGGTVNITVTQGGVTSDTSSADHYTYQ